MRNFLKCSSFIRMAIIIVVMAFLAGQATESYARGNKSKTSQRDDSTTGGGSIQSGGMGGTGGRGQIIVHLLEDILAQLEECCPGDGGGDCGDGGGFPCQDGGTPVGDRWVVSDSGAVVCDLDTGYSWQQHPLSFLRTWQEAVDYCPTLGDGWILPDIDTLKTLVDTSNTNPSLETGHPFDNVQSWLYWSSTTVADNTASAWFVTFDVGVVNSSNKAGSRHAWCVRGGS